MTAVPPPRQSEELAERDERVAEMLQRLLEQARQGVDVDPEALAREHPDLAGELRELVATAMIADEFGSLSDALADEEGAAAAVDAAAEGGDPAAARSGEQFGDYELLEEIGRGGMGVVFKARQRSLGRIVALKMILGGPLASPADLARFRTEAESAARLSHPHIVPVYQVGEHDGQPFFSMQLVEGTTLARRLAAPPAGGLPPREAASLLAPICRAVAEAHRHGLLHRDLKPSNILIDREGRPYVSDFGLAKRVESAPDVASVRHAKASALTKGGPLTALTASGAILGTPGYMAPEQAGGTRGEVAAAADVYSLGALLYAMLTGRAPFQAASPVDTVLMVLEQDPPPARLLNPHVDPDLEMIALKCLQKPPDLRYASADALADDLERYLAGEPVSARSGRFTQVLSRAFRETHHAAVLENWGLLWMWHSLVLLVLCLVTNWFQWRDVGSRWPYLGLWGAGLTLWAAIFWQLRRRTGPITFVERQIAHVWAGSIAGCIGLYVIEWILNLPVLTLSPVLGLIGGGVHLAKAGILSGRFYAYAAMLFATAPLMAVLPEIGLMIFGVAAAGSYFFPGWKYHRQRMRAVVPAGQSVEEQERGKAQQHQAH